MRVDQLRAALFETTDGSVACDAINELVALAELDNEDAKSVLADYVRDGPIKHMREHACAGLAGQVNEPNPLLATVFERGLTDPNVRYWSILGYLNATGREGYLKIVRIAEDRSLPLNERAHAVKCLSKYSKQQFDRGLSSDPGYWRESDLRLTELRKWVDGGCKDGTGYPELVPHPALVRPQTRFEKLVRKLDDLLAVERKKRQDLAQPTNWLLPAAPGDIAEISAKWKLPATYLDFLTRFSPLRVNIISDQFWNPFWLFGASEIIQAQDGYSFDPVAQLPIDDWPGHYVVIASDGGDPYVLDLSASDGNDAPVLTAIHGQGLWEFEPASASFEAFLDELTSETLPVLE